MSTNEEIYKELRKQFSDEEIVERYVFSDDLTDQEKQKVEEEFRALRLKSLKERTEEERLLAELMRMKLLIQDYLKEDDFDQAFSFSNQLGLYIKIIDRNQKDFATEIDIHPTKLSRLLNDRENPNIELVYRLEKHCGHIIPAIFWWKLHAKKLEDKIQNDNQKRQTESKRVTNNLKFRA